MQNQRSIFDWKAKNGAILPVKIGSELETSRIFGFDYGLEDARITSDGFFENDIIFGPGYDLCSKLNVVKSIDKVSVTILLISRYGVKVLTIITGAHPDNLCWPLRRRCGRQTCGCERVRD